MSDVVDDDTVAAVLVRYQEDHELLPALFDRLPTWGRVKSFAGLPEQSRRMPFLQVNCELANRECAGTDATGLGNPFHDHRIVTFTVWATKAHAKDALDYLRRLFNTQTELVYPSGARFLRWWPDKETRLEQDTSTREAEDVWKGMLIADVWSIRVG